MDLKLTGELCPRQVLGEKEQEEALVERKGRGEE
jgi:hypothetical protein